jgi:hypothetical protein
LVGLLSVRAAGDLTIPEILWEASLGIYLAVKGFKPSPILRGVSAMPGNHKNSLVDLPQLEPPVRDSITRARVTKLVALFLAIFALFSAVAFGARSLGASFDAAGIVSTLVLLMAITFIGTKVSYRCRDLGLLLIPVVGLYCWLMWIWRLASLPDRYWDRSSEDTARLKAAKDREIQADLSLREHWDEEVSKERKRRIRF